MSEEEQEKFRTWLGIDLATWTEIVKAEIDKWGKWPTGTVNTSVEPFVDENGTEYHYLEPITRDMTDWHPSPVPGTLREMVEGGR